MSLPQPPTDITKNKRYALAILFAAILAAIAQMLLVPPAWRHLWETTAAGKEPTAQNQAPTESVPSTTPPVTSSPAEPNAPVTPPVTQPPAEANTPAKLPVTPQGVCGMWISETSRKKYNFICQGQNAFVIYEVVGQVLTNAGSGRITEDGNVEADILVKEKSRTAHLRLKLSSDGQKIEGAWYGDDPRESGHLVFHKL